MTIGFCLIMAGWFTPPTNDTVYHVRLTGPVAFLTGFFLLVLSCLVCGIEQRRCCLRRSPTVQGRPFATAVAGEGGTRGTGPGVGERIAHVTESQGGVEGGALYRSQRNRVDGVMINEQRLLEVASPVSASL